MRLSSPPLLVCCLKTMAVSACDAHSRGEAMGQRTRPRLPPPSPGGERRRDLGLQTGDTTRAGRRHSSEPSAVPTKQLDQASRWGLPLRRPYGSGHRDMYIRPRAPGRVMGGGKVGFYAACGAVRILKTTTWSRIHTHARTLDGTGTQHGHRHQMEAGTGEEAGHSVRALPGKPTLHLRPDVVTCNPKCRRHCRAPL